MNAKRCKHPLKKCYFSFKPKISNSKIYNSPRWFTLILKVLENCQLIKQTNQVMKIAWFVFLHDFLVDMAELMQVN